MDNAMDHDDLPDPNPLAIVPYRAEKENVEPSFQDCNVLSTMCLL